MQIQVMAARFVKEFMKLEDGNQLPADMTKAVSGIGVRNVQPIADLMFYQSLRIERGDKDKTLVIESCLLFNGVPCNFGDRLMEEFCLSARTDQEAFSDYVGTLTLDAVVFPAPGVYHMVVRVNNQQVADVPLTVQFV